MRFRIDCPCDMYHGINLETGVFIASFENDSPASSSSLSIGDRVISVSYIMRNCTGSGQNN